MQLFDSGYILFHVLQVSCALIKAILSIRSPIFCLWWNLIFLESLILPLPYYYLKLFIWPKSHHLYIFYKNGSSGTWIGRMQSFPFIMAQHQELFSWVVSCMIATSGLDVTSQWKTAESNLLTVFSILSSDLCMTLFGFCLWCLWVIGEYVNSRYITFWVVENEGKYFHDGNLSDNITLGKVIISYHVTSCLLHSSCSVSARSAWTPLPCYGKNLSLPKSTAQQGS